MAKEDPTIKKSGISISVSSALKIVIAISLFFILLGANLRLLTSDSYVLGRQELLNSNSRQAGTRSKQYTSEILDFLLHRTEDLAQSTRRERQHLVDVRNLLDLANQAFMASVLVFGLAVFALWRRQKNLVRDLLDASVITIAGVGALLAALLLDFSSFFERFHRLFFLGDSWQFAAHS